MTLLNKTALKNCVSMTILTSALLIAGSASAQQINQQSGIADPGRLERQFNEELKIPQSSPNISVKKLSLQKAPAGAENIKFKFGGVQLNGLNTYTEEEIYPLYKNIMGETITLADLYSLANRITSKYRNDGYILTQVVVPPQTIESGIPRLRVVEGYIDNVTIQGGSEDSTALKTIQNYARQISNGGALNIADMERQLLLINDLPGMSARSVISPSTTKSGAADLLVILERNPYEALVSIDNHGSRFLGPVQLGAAGRLNSFFGRNETITAQTVLAPDGGAELLYGSLGYEQPVGRHGTTLSLTGSITDTDPGYTLSQFGVEGLSRSIALQAKHPLIRSRGTNVFGRLTFDWRNVDSKNSFTPKIEDRIRAIRAGVKAEFLDNLLGVAVNTIDFELSQGLGILDATDTGDVNTTRAAGDGQFTKANINIARLQKVTNNINISLKGSAQASNDPLLSSEEFGLGGMNSVRGYDPSEAVGDDAINGKVELQWNNQARDAQVFTFVDSGTVWNKDSTNSAGKRTSLTSTGAGVRLDLNNDIDAEFVAALPLHKNIQTKGERNAQFFFSLNKKF